jgi:hypothetical protein
VRRAELVTKRGDDAQQRHEAAFQVRVVQDGLDKFARHVRLFVWPALLAAEYLHNTLERTAALHQAVAIVTLAVVFQRGKEFCVSVLEDRVLEKL